MYLHIGLLSKKAVRALGCGVLAIVAAYLFFWPFGAEQQAAKRLIIKTISHPERFPNYDIRTDKEAGEKLAAFRGSSKKTASDIADIRHTFVRGEDLLKTRVPSLKVEYNNDIRTPEIIAPDVTQGEAVLARGLEKSRADTLRSFLDQNKELVGARSEQITELVT